MKIPDYRSIVAYTTLIVLLIVVGFPLYWMISSAFKPGPELFVRPPKLYPSSFTTQWLAEILFRSNAPDLFLHSFIVAFGTLILNILLGSVGAYSLARFRYPGRNIFLYSSLISYVFPAILIFVPLYIILSSLKVIDTLIGLVLTHTIITLPLSLWLLRSFFLSIPRELEEAALVDGATELRAFFHVTLPLSVTGILSTGILAFILSWNEFLFASAVALSADTKTLPVGIAEFVTSYDIRWGEIMALGTLTTIPVLIFFLLIQKYFVRGFLAGALKG